MKKTHALLFICLFGAWESDFTMTADDSLLHWKQQSSSHPPYTIFNLCILTIFTWESHLRNVLIHALEHLGRDVNDCPILETSNPKKKKKGAKPYLGFDA